MMSRLHPQRRTLDCLLRSWIPRAATASRLTAAAVEVCHDPSKSSCQQQQQRSSFATGTRGSRGHGWLTRYREGRGGRHLQGPHFDAPTLDEKLQWNDSIFQYNINNNNNNKKKNNNTMAYMDIQIQTANTTSTTTKTTTTKTTEVVEEASPQTEANNNKDDSNSSSSFPTTHRLSMELASSVLDEACQHFETLIRDGVYKDTLLDRIEQNVGWRFGSPVKNGSHRPPLLSSFAEDSSTPLVLWHVPGTVTLLSPKVGQVDTRMLMCTHEAPQLDGYHVPFARLSHESLQFLQDTQLFTKRGRPTVNVQVVECGILIDEKEPHKNGGGGGGSGKEEDSVMKEQNHKDDNNDDSEVTDHTKRQQESSV